MDFEEIMETMALGGLVCVLIGGGLAAFYIIGKELITISLKGWIIAIAGNAVIFVVFFCVGWAAKRWISVHIT